MKSYSKTEFAHVRKLVNEEVKAGVHSLRASYLADKYGLSVSLVQQALSDLVAIGDLRTHYQVLCSGPNQNFDADREYTDQRLIPRHEITCQKCGDRYVPLEEHILVSFEPTDSYLEALGQTIERPTKN